MATREDPTTGVKALSYETELACGHWNEEVEAILDTLGIMEMGAFVEIGVHVGGLTDTLMQWMKKRPWFLYLGVEINESVIDRGLLQRIDAMDGNRAAILIRDAWSYDTVLEVKRMLRGLRSSFIYCDGGDKRRELALWAPHARKNDIVAVHDFGCYDGAEISPYFADTTMSKLSFRRFSPYWVSKDVRIAMWKKS